MQLKLMFTGSNNQVEYEVIITDPWLEYAF